jgi:serine/threonine protein kinase
MPLVPEDCSDLLKDFLTQCFDKDPSKRPSARGLAEHKWLKAGSASGQKLNQQISVALLGGSAQTRDKSVSTNVNSHQLSTEVTSSSLSAFSPPSIPHRRFTGTPSTSDNRSSMRNTPATRDVIPKPDGSRRRHPTSEWWRTTTTNPTSTPSSSNNIAAQSSIQGRKRDRTQRRCTIQ